MTFGELIRQARRDLGLTQGEVAKECGISQALICQYEQGRYKPLLENALKLCKYLGISLDDYKLTVSIPADFPRPKLVRSEQSN
jgi:transcriptional regulator with XRE-family HTH domain